MHPRNSTISLLGSIFKRAGAFVRPNGWVPRVVVACALSAVLTASLAQTPEPEPVASPRLGVPEVLSPMGSPLWIRIPVDATEAAISAAGASFALGPRPANAGIPFIDNAEISFERQGDKHFLVIRSRQPVNELAVGLVIREQLIRGVRSREFTVLLDPPVLFDAILAARATVAPQKAESLLPKALPQVPVIEPSSAARASPRVRPAKSSQPKIVLDFPKREVRLFLFFSEADAQQVAAQLRKKATPATVISLLKTLHERMIRRVLSTHPASALRIIHESAPTENLALPMASNVVKLVGGKLSSKVREWVATVLSKEMAQNYERITTDFVSAASNDADGVTLQITLQAPPILEPLRAALKGGLTALPRLLKAFGKDTMGSYRLAVRPGFGVR